MDSRLVALPAALTHDSLVQMSLNQRAYTIRAARATDCELLAMMRRKLQAALEGENRAMWTMTDARKEALPAFYEYCVADAGVQVLVAEDLDSNTSRIVGTAVGRLEVGRDVARYGSIEDVWVEPEYRGRGICRALIAQLTEFFQTHGVQKLTVGFAYGGTAAGLWQRLGFTPAVVIANSDVDTVRTRSAYPRNRGDGIDPQ
jgi:ribosomal protein S18 acetylase RimI-like enzyme